MKRTSIKDVARVAGVSITTVSRALNGYSDVSLQTREKIEKVAEELNYAPDVNARSLGGMSDTTIALLVSDLQKKDESGLAFGIISGLYNACTKFGCEFILLATNAVKQEKTTYLQLCRQKNVDGVVVMGLRMDDPYYKEVLESVIPCALIDMGIESENICNISVDNIAAAKEAVRYLLACGHKEIGMINGEAAAEVSKERFTGYAKALLDAGILLKLEYLKDGDFKEVTAYEKTKELLLAHENITALFCASDLMAIGAIRAVKELGKRVPEDISVVGFDDIPIAQYVCGGITTVRQNPYEIGQMAGDALYHMLKKEKREERYTAASELIIRGTVAHRL